MERFRLRVREEAKRGQIWELHLFPNMPGRHAEEGDAKIIGSSSTPEAIQWLRELSEKFERQTEDTGTIASGVFRPGCPAHWLRQIDGMRLALAFSSARYLTKASQRSMFRTGLVDLPSEVVLYWFTLCFYGYRQHAGRAALRTLLTFEQSDEKLDSIFGGEHRDIGKRGRPTVSRPNRNETPELRSPHVEENDGRDTPLIETEVRRP